MQKISPFLWFNTEAEEAANFYVSVFKDSKINHISRYLDAGKEITGKDEGTVMTVNFEIAGQSFTALNGGPLYKFNESISFVVSCEDQEEIDYYWDKLSAVPESEQCGWVKDKFGISWQIVPANMGELIKTPQAVEAMLKMKKIDINELRKLSEGK